ncbi:MAG: hypothetical protein D6751_11550 [Deltaproteobacteria bacterium]|nr:MAG: hypothetical protein D6751_11550 [Deltaproteobacteria bacterium]
MWSLVDDKQLNNLLLVITGLAGLALGTFAAALAGYLLQPAETAGSMGLTTPPRAERPRTLADYQVILDRNLFNPDGPRLRFSPASGTSRPAATTAPRRAADWQLVGTVSGGPRPLATLRGQGKTRVWHQGDRLPDGSILTGVERSRARLRLPDGSESVLTLPKQGDKNQPASAAGNHQGRSVRAPAARQSAAIGAGIRQLAPNSWQIPRLEAERARDNIGTLLRQARVEPNLVEGRTEGFVIRMIQPGTLLARLGLKVGDVLHEINGISLDGPEKGLQIMQQLRQARRIDLALERQGKRLTYSYRID